MGYMNRFEYADTPTPSHNPNIVAWCVTLVGAKSKHSFTVSLLFLATFILPHSLLIEFHLDSIRVLVTQ